MNKLIVKLTFILLIVAAIDAQARGGGQGGMQGQGMGSRQGSTGVMDHDRIFQREQQESPGKKPERTTATRDEPGT